MTYQVNDLIRDIDSIIPEVEKELLNRKNGIEGDGSVQQLELIKKELEQIKSYALTNNLPSKEKRFTSFSRYVIDEWSYNSTLGQRLCELADKYKRKLQ
ncbi:hypothetical protein ACPVTF_07695 [Geobacillus icigianus]|uniref:Uncharacterized protein n=1 Tax=Geobacillus subterraneus TaxID=129338 RepID=A0A679FPJ9_9BACL|nr:MULTISPECIES: hypothetical protein [Geobacillus]KYD23912.1 hypothetical protein B4113_3277 [Geobacillus sp. B4113_201601]BBW96525.1 hypothetical protein GsuE55_13580 [Geobacillus subterraneus]